MWFCALRGAGQRGRLAASVEGRGGTYHAIGLHVGGAHALRLLHGLLPDDLNPIPVGIEHERDALHAPIRQLLLERVAGVLEALAGGLDVVDGDAGVSEAAEGLGVAVHDVVVRVGLGAVVVRQLDEPRPVAPLARVREGERRVVAEEVEVEFGFGLGDLAEHFHAEEFVELDCWGGR